MPVTCTPNALLAASACLRCLTPDQLQAVKTYLLAVYLGEGTDPDTVAAAAKCYSCGLDPYLLKRIQVALLCKVVQGSTPCDTQVIVTGSVPFASMPAGAFDAVAVYLLATRAGQSTEPQALLTAARCFLCADYPHGAAQAYLLAQIAARSAALRNGLFEVWTFNNSMVGSVQGFEFNCVNPLYGSGRVKQGVAWDGNADRTGTAPGTNIFNIAADFTIGGWLIQPTSGGTVSLVRAGNYSVLEDAFILGFLNAMQATNTIFNLNHNGVARSVNITGVELDTWICMMAGYDATLDVPFLRRGNGAIVNGTAFGVAPSSNIQDISIGTSHTGAANTKGRGDILALWERKLSLPEMDFFYNNGLGIEYPF